MCNYIERLSEVIIISNDIVFFGGAGISTDSKIPDFIISNGLFSQKLNITFIPLQLVLHSFFIAYPIKVLKLNTSHT